MKVLFLSSWYPSAENPAFGVFVKEHAKAIQTTSAEIVVVAILVFRSRDFLKKNVLDSVDESGIRTVKIILHTRFRDFIYHFIPLQKRIVYRYVKKHILADFTPDFIHSNVVFPAGMIGDFISRKIKKPHIITEHWSKIPGILSKPFLSSLAIKSYQNAVAILPVSEFLKSNILNLLPDLSPEKLHVIPNIIDRKTFSFEEKQNSDEIRFCALATWSTKRNPDKLPELFIEALNSFHQKTGRKILLTILGGGNRLDELKALASKQSYPVEFTGPVPKPEIALQMQKTHYFVHASTIETFGVVIAEALMTGTPVICSNVAALPELVNESNGVLCENTVESWVAGIEKAVMTTFDNKKISETVRDKFSYLAVGQKIEDVYKNL